NITSEISANVTKELDDITTTISDADEISIGYQCARQLRNQNATIVYHYNITDFTLTNVSYNYSSVNVSVLETYTYNNNSYLNQTEWKTQ
ncbi:hypothetical protein LCGC14_2021900, partial [marine sediment metagenome]